MIELTNWKDSGGRLVEEVVRPVDNKLVIRLAENPTTGYRWEVLNLSTNDVNIKLDEFEPSIPHKVQMEQMICGSGGHRILTFELGPDATEVNLCHCRPWMKGKDGDDATHVTLKLV